LNNLKEQRGGGGNNARMPRNPAHICYAREAVAGVHVEYVLDAERGAEKIPARGVHDTLGLAGRAGGLCAGSELIQLCKMGRRDARRG
jgi:hypothetical protein